MRLSWPFRRSEPSPEPPTADASGGGVGPSTPRARAAWRDLPPLAETIGPPPLVAPNQPFAAGLAASESPSPILAPLAHGRSLEAPRGLVVGLARPTTSPVGAPLPKPVQRSPLSGARLATDLRNAFAAGSESSDASPPTDPAASTPSTRPADAPVFARRLPVVTSSSSDAGTAVRDLMRTSPAAAPAPAVGRVGQPSAPGAGGRASTTTATTMGPVIQRAPTIPEAPAAPRPVADPVEDRPRLTLGQTRRQGLGAPIAGGPILAGSATLLSPSEAPLAMPLTGAVARPGGEVPGSGGDPRVPTGERAAGDSTSVASSATLPPPAPDATRSAARPLDRATARPTAPGMALSGGRRPHADRGNSPLVSAEPLRTGVQRSPLTIPSSRSSGGAVDGAGGDGAGQGASTARSSSDDATELPGGVRVHRGSTATQLAQSLDARAFTRGSDVYLPASHGSLSAGPARSLLAHELTHVAQQRRLGSALPAETTPDGHALEAEAVAAERGGTLALAQPSPRGHTASAPSPSDPATQRSASIATPTPPDEPAMVRSSPVTQRAPANGGTDSTSASGPRRSEQELEDLAHELYGRIGRRLRRELLVDRERAGFVMDRP